MVLKIAKSGILQDFGRTLPVNEAKTVKKI
jgi:hypothetical protein